MCNEDLRKEFKIANVRQWEVADAIGISEITMVKWLINATIRMYEIDHLKMYTCEI